MKNTRLHTSALLFFAYAAFGGINAFLNLFYRQQGMDLVQVGILAAVSPTMTLLVSPLWAAVADRFNLHRYILPLTMLLSIPFALLLGRMQSFEQLLLGIALFAGCFCAIVPLTDNAVLVNLGGQKKEYGRIRLWGSLGIGVMAWLSGYLVEGRPLNIIFTLYVFLMTIAVVVAYYLPKAPQVKIQSYWRSARQFWHDPRWRIFLPGCLLAGLSHLFHGYFLFIFAKSLGAADTLLGFLVAVSAGTNVLIYLSMPRILRRWSPQQVMLFSNALMIVRCAITAIIKTPDWLILISAMDGLTWGTMWAAGVQHANEIAPHGLGASAQAVYNAVFVGLGGIMGASLGGMIFSAWGSAALFTIAAVMAALSSLVFMRQVLPFGRDAKQPIRQI